MAGSGWTAAAGSCGRGCVAPRFFQRLLRRVAQSGCHAAPAREGARRAQAAAAAAGARRPRAPPAPLGAHLAGPRAGRRGPEGAEPRKRAERLSERVIGAPWRSWELAATVTGAATTLRRAKQVTARQGRSGGGKRDRGAGAGRRWHPNPRGRGPERPADRPAERAAPRPRPPALTPRSTSPQQVEARRAAGGERTRERRPTPSPTGRSNPPDLRGRGEVLGQVRRGRSCSWARRRESRSLAGPPS